MDNDIPDTFELIVAEFSRRHLVAHKKLDLEKLLRKARDEALIGTIKHYADKLDLVAIYKVPVGSFDMAHRIQDDLFFDAESDLFFRANCAQPKTERVFTVKELSTDDLTVQWTQQILMSISEKVADRSERKIILPHDAFFFTWKESWGAAGACSDEVDKNKVLFANSFEQAIRQLCIRYLFKENHNNHAEELKVYFGDKGYIIKMSDATGDQIKSLWEGDKTRVKFALADK